MTGLRTPFQGRLLRDVAEDVLKWAKVSLMLMLIVLLIFLSGSLELDQDSSIYTILQDGLDRRRLNESNFLDPLMEVVRTGI